MTEPDFDPALFGLWSKAPVYDGLAAGGREAALMELAGRVILDMKAHATSLDDLQDMLNGMTKELREQMQQFQRLRDLARQREEAAGDEVDRKLVQADAKASIEAMSLIVRTLEKIDSLQRTIAHDRQLLAEAAYDAADDETLMAEFEEELQRRVDERVHGRTGDAGRAGGGDDDGGVGGAGDPRQAAGPP
jgi:chromosome segregation ATPase